MDIKNLSKTKKLSLMLGVVVGLSGLVVSAMLLLFSSSLVGWEISSGGYDITFTEDLIGWNIEAITSGNEAITKQTFVMIQNNEPFNKDFLVNINKVVTDTDLADLCEATSLQTEEFLTYAGQTLIDGDIFEVDMGAGKLFLNMEVLPLACRQNVEYEVTLSVI